MKKLVLMFALIAISVVVKAQVEKVEIKTSAVCEMCKAKIEKDLVFEKGVKSSDLNVDTKIVTVEYDASKTSPEKICERISKLGYNANTVVRDEKAYEKLPNCCKDGGH